MRIGIDVGGTKIEGIALALDGRELRRLRIPAPRGDYQQTLDAVASVVASLERDTGQRGSVGLGIPGTPSPATGLIKNANSTWLIGRPFGPDLARLLDRPVQLENDANCFALSEATDGAAQGAGVVFGVILGTGCGGGVVVHQRVHRGPNAIAGEWGHNRLPAPKDGERPGPPCYCGQTGCIETFLSGPGLSRDYVSSGGPARAAIEIAALAGDGDRLAASALDRYEERLARALTTVLNLLDPDVIVLGGGLSNIERLYENVPRLLRPFGGEPVRTPLVRAVHGDSSGVRGAAWLGAGTGSLR